MSNDVNAGFILDDERWFTLCCSDVNISAPSRGYAPRASAADGWSRFHLSMKRMQWKISGTYSTRHRCRGSEGEVLLLKGWTKNLCSIKVWPMILSLRALCVVHNCYCSSANTSSTLQRGMCTSSVCNHTALLQGFGVSSVRRRRPTTLNKHWSSSFQDGKSVPFFETADSGRPLCSLYAC